MIRISGAWPSGVDKPPEMLDEFAPSVPLSERDSKLGLKLLVNRLVLANNGIDVLVWLASGVGENMDRGGHPAAHPGCVGRAPDWRPAAGGWSPRKRQRWQHRVNEWFVRDAFAG